MLESTPAAGIVVGIVIPLYKGERFLPGTLASIRDQTFPHWRCVLVDDGSPDRSAAIAQASINTDHRFSLIRKKNEGVSAARNAGFAALPPEVTHVSFMDQDDLYLPDALQTLAQACREHPRAIGAHGIAELIDENSRPLLPGSYSRFCRERIGYRDGGIASFEASAPTCFESLLFINPVCPPGLALIRREIYDRAGAWDRTLANTQDWDMLLRLCRHGDLAYVNRVILHYRRHADNGSNNLGRADREMRRVYHKTFFAPENTAEHCKTLKAGWRAWQVYRAREKFRQLEASLASLSPRDGIRATAHLFVHAIRYVRGYPTRTGW